MYVVVLCQDEIFGWPGLESEAQSPRASFTYACSSPGDLTLIFSVDKALVCYDVVADRRRNRLMNRLKGFLPHVQKSVFEGELTERRLTELREMIQREIDQTEDTVRIYSLCARCIPATEVIGTGVYVQRGEEDEVV